jgi:predicted Zn-dependent protease
VRLRPAEATLRELIGRAPGDAYAYLLLGRVLQRQGRHEEAKGPLRMAAMMNPELALSVGQGGDAVEPGAVDQ